MKVFWSWQSDYSPETNRHFIHAALDEAVKQVGAELGLEQAERPKLDHDTKNVPGAAAITETILNKISESGAFVADLTPIRVSDKGKALPNPNVLIELGWAAHALGWERIIIIINTGSGYRSEDLPFDIRHRRIMPYELATGASKDECNKTKSKLTTELLGALKINLGQRTEKQAEVVSFDRMVPAKVGDRSVWATLGDELKYKTMDGDEEKVVVRNGPRAYIRIIPSGWNNDQPPSASTIESEDLNGCIQRVAPATEGPSGLLDYGLCSEGYVRCWRNGGGDETSNISMWFDATGEYWIIHAPILREDNDGKKRLLPKSFFRGWRHNLRSAMMALDRYEANPVRRVEAGVVGIEGTVMWRDDTKMDSAPARAPESTSEEQKSDWSDDAQVEFLTEAYNKIRKNFGLRHVKPSNLKAITDTE